MNECTHSGSSGLCRERGRLLPPQGLLRVGGRAWGPDVFPGCSHLSSAMEEATEEGGCFLGFGQASFVFFNKGID